MAWHGVAPIGRLTLIAGEPGAGMAVRRWQTFSKRGGRLVAVFVVPDTGAVGEPESPGHGATAFDQAADQSAAGQQRDIA
jgi:hypothetical protein